MKRQVLDFLRRLVTHNPLFKLVSVAVAVVLWAWLQSDQVVQESAWVEVSYQLPDDLVMAQAATKRLRVTVQGPQRYVKKVRGADLALTIDMRDAAPGVQQVDFVDSEIVGITTQEIDIVGLVPNSVQVDIEEKHSLSVAVSPTIVGEPVTGYRLAQIEVDPSEVVVAGPFSVVERLARLPTAPVNVAGLTESKTFSVPVTLKPRTLTRATSDPVQVRVVIEAMTSQRTFTKVPVIVRSRDWTASVEALTVTLSGPVSALQAIDHDAVAVMVRIEPETSLEPVQATLEGGAGVAVMVVHGGGVGVEVVTATPATFMLTPVGEPAEP